MKRKSLFVVVMMVLCVSLVGTVAAQPSVPYVPDAPVGTAFTYQGRLTDGGVPANGTYDFDFILYDLPSAGNVIGNILKNDVSMTNGLFVVTLDYGASAFNGQARYLQIWVRPGASTGGYTALSPRQELTATPYALFSKAPWATIGNDISYTQGKVGMGTTTPLTQLHVKGNTASTGNNTAVFENTTIGPYASAIHYGTTGDWYIRSALVTGTVVIQDAGGKVGIGTTSPCSNTKLHVYAGNSLVGCIYDAAVRGENSNGDGVLGLSSDKVGVSGISGSSAGVQGLSNSGDGVWGYSSTGYAGNFQGDVVVHGTLTKAGGSFKIDHPLDPANQYLYHSFVESPDMKNIYDGVVTLDANGEATVTLPDWFGALNGDFRYQLTAMGAPGPNLYIAQEIQNNRFKIAGGKAGMKVSWQVTGIRHDPWAEQHRIPVEEQKPPNERGKYLYPKEYGQPETLGIDYEMQQRMQQKIGESP